MSKQFGVFSVETAAEIHRRVLGNSSPQKPTDGQKRLLLPAREYYVKLTEDLAEASNPETGYTQAEAVFLRYKQPAEDTLSMEESGEDSTLTVTNRSTSYSATSGSVLQVKRIGAEWAPVHASGGANSSSDVCPCFCLDNGNLYVHEIETTDVWEVSLGELVWEFENGYVVLPAGKYKLVWDELTETWKLDIGDSLQAYYYDDSSATLASILDGEITLTLNPDGSADLKVCISATIPQKIYDEGVVVGLNYGLKNGYIDGFAGNPYDDRVVFAGQTGTASGTGAWQQFGTETLLEPGTGTYGDTTGTGTGTGTFMWSDYEEGFYAGYRSGYAQGYSLGTRDALVTGTGSGTGSYYDGDPSFPLGVEE